MAATGSPVSGQISCTITITGNTAELNGNYPRDVVRKVTSYYAPNYKFSDAFRSGKWDGRKHLFNKRKGTMPAGLVPSVVEALEAAGGTVTVNNAESYETPVTMDMSLETIDFGVGKYSYQKEAVLAALNAKRGVWKIATNGGKCLHPDTPVILYSGNVVKAQDVKVGDTLMGPDGFPREVLGTCRGKDTMFRISPKRGGDPFVCNSVHVLTIFDAKTQQVIDVPLDEYLRWNKDRKRLSRLVRTGVDFPQKEYTLGVDPWLLGLWYADGTKGMKKSITITNDGELEEELKQQAAKHNTKLIKSVYGKKCPTFRFVTKKGQPNPLKRAIAAAVGDLSSLPEQVLKGSRTVRSAFLAGFIDGDGYGDGKGAVSILTKHKQWSEDLAFLARSLGFLVSVSNKKVALPDWEAPKTYWRLYIYGDNTSLPIQLNRKKVKPKKQWNSVGFRVEEIGHGYYSGFELSGDGRFLLGDFTITHNTSCAAALIKCLQVPTLFLVERVNLVNQTIERFAEYLNISEKDVGKVGDGSYTYGDWITIATPKTLKNLMKPEDADRWRLVIADECHRAANNTFYSVLEGINAPWRLGMSGTPLSRSDGADLRLIAQTGPVIYEVSNEFLVERGISVPPTVEMIRVTSPVILQKDLSWSDVEDIGIVGNEHLNNIIIKRAVAEAEKGKQVLVLVNIIDHGKKLIKAIKSELGETEMDTALGKMSKAKFISGKESTKVRDRALKNFAKTKIKILVATSILDEGIDVPNIDVLILGGGGKAKTKLLQRVGRGLRTGEDKEGLLVVDFANYTHKWHLKHSLERLRLYKAENCFKILSK